MNSKHETIFIGKFIKADAGQFAVGRHQYKQTQQKDYNMTQPQKVDINDLMRRMNIKPREPELKFVGDIKTAPDVSKNGDGFDVFNASEERAVLERTHIGLIGLIEENKDNNGSALSSPEGEVNGEPITENNHLLRLPSSKAMNAIQFEPNAQDANTISNRDSYDGGVASSVADATNERLDRLEKTLEHLISLMSSTKTPEQTNHVGGGLIDFATQVPDKIVIQYFKNAKSKSPPTIKLELREKARDVSGKLYYRDYCVLHGNLAGSFGRGKLDKLVALSINKGNIDDIWILRNFINNICDEYRECKSLMGVVFYDYATNELFPYAYMLVDKLDDWAMLFIYNGEQFISEEVKFIESKSAGKKKGADGIYTINKDVIDCIFNCDDNESE